MPRWRGNTVMLKGKNPNQRKQGKRHWISACQPYRSPDSSWWVNFHGRGKEIWELLQIFLPMPICTAGQAAGPGEISGPSVRGHHQLAPSTVCQWDGLGMNAFHKATLNPGGHHGTNWFPTQPTHLSETGERSSRDELGIIMFSVQPLFAAPGQKGFEGGVRILCHITFIPIIPDLQPHQSNPDVQGPVKLRHRKEKRW